VWLSFWGVRNYGCTYQIDNHPPPQIDNHNKRAVSRADLRSSNTCELGLLRSRVGCTLLSVKREPVVAGVLALDGVVAAGLAAAVTFGWLELSAEQTAAVVGFVAAVSAVVAGVVRGKVTPDPDGVWDGGYTEGFDDGLFMPVPIQELDPAFVPSALESPDDLSFD